jgi:hypothetical protein
MMPITRSTPAGGSARAGPDGLRLSDWNPSPGAAGIDTDLDRHDDAGLMLYNRGGRVLYHNLPLYDMLSAQCY